MRLPPKSCSLFRLRRKLRIPFTARPPKWRRAPRRLWRATLRSRPSPIRLSSRTWLLLQLPIPTRRRRAGARVSTRSWARLPFRRAGRRRLKRTRAIPRCRNRNGNLANRHNLACTRRAATPRQRIAPFTTRSAPATLKVGINRRFARTKAMGSNLRRRATPRSSMFQILNRA